MDAILTYNKETGKIQSIIPGFDVEYFLKTQYITVKSFAPVFNSEGQEIGTREIELYDPIIKDYIKVRTTLDSSLNVAVITNRTREELLTLVVPEYEYPQTPYNLIDKNGAVVDTIQLSLPEYVKTERKGIDANGGVILEEKSRKAFDGYEHIVILTKNEQNFDDTDWYITKTVDEIESKVLDFNLVIADLHNNYVIQNNNLVKVEPTVE